MKLDLTFRTLITPLFATDIPHIGAA